MIVLGGPETAAPSSRAAARRRPGPVLVVAAAAALLSGCAGWAGGQTVTTGATRSGTAGTAAPATVTMPDLAGENLRDAVAWAQRFAVDDSSYDDTGRGRLVMLTIDWKVCHQDPAAGTEVRSGLSRPDASAVSFGVVRTSEDCPAVSVPLQTPKAAAGHMPSLVGLPLSLVTTWLNGHDASGSAHDALHHRMILAESNWQVCTQSIAKGDRLPSGAYVKLGVVKFGETCP